MYLLIAQTLTAVAKREVRGHAYRPNCVPVAFGAVVRIIATAAE